MKKIFLDIETDFRKKILNIAWCSEKKSDEGKEFWIYQNEKDLVYPKDADPKYISILGIWREKVANNKTTSLKIVLAELIEDTKDAIVCGWNIRDFDIPIINIACERHLGMKWNPMIFDGYKYIKNRIKETPATFKNLMTLNGPTKSGKFPSLTAESMFKYTTGWKFAIETHIALSDAQQERVIIKEMAKAYRFSVDKMAKLYNEQLELAL